MSTATDKDVLERLNTYTGRRIWHDVVWNLDVDEDATAEANPNCCVDTFVLDDGRTFRHDRGSKTWSKVE